MTWPFSAGRGSSSLSTASWPCSSSTTTGGSPRSFLRDAFELLGPLGYRLGKLTPHGVEFYPGWDAELETFVEGNYLACVPQVAERLPSVVWWKSAS